MADLKKESNEIWSSPDAEIIAFYIAQEAAVEKRREVSKELNLSLRMLFLSLLFRAMTIFFPWRLALRSPGEDSLQVALVCSERFVSLLHAVTKVLTKSSTVLAETLSMAV